MNEDTYRQQAFDQSTHLSAPGSPSATSGVCHLFALKWASLIVSDKSLGTGARIGELDRHASEVRILYKSFGDRWNREGGKRADEGIAKTLGLKIDKLEEPGTKAIVHAHVRAEHRVAFVYSFWWADGSGHSIGVYRSGAKYGGHIYVFEPNFGEYKMKKSQFGDWLTWLEGSYASGPFAAHQLRHFSAYEQKAVAGGVKVM
jgi:hypothetical protein